MCYRVFRSNIFGAIFECKWTVWGRQWRKALKMWLGYKIRSFLITSENTLAMLFNSSHFRFCPVKWRQSERPSHWTLSGMGYGVEPHSHAATSFPLTSFRKIKVRINYNVKDFKVREVVVATTWLVFSPSWGRLSTFYPTFKQGLSEQTMSFYQKRGGGEKKKYLRLDSIISNHLCLWLPLGKSQIKSLSQICLVCFLYSYMVKSRKRIQALLCFFWQS